MFAYFLWPFAEGLRLSIFPKLLQPYVYPLYPMQCTKCTTVFPGSSSWSKVVPLQPECNLRQLGQFPKQANTPNSRHSCTKAHANQQKNLFKNCSQILSCFGSTFHADKVMAKGFYLKLLQLHCSTTTRWQKCNQTNVFTTVLPWAKLNAPKKSIRYSDLD